VIADRPKPWLRAELKATLALAYPLILTNLAQALIPATDVVLLGWAGPQALAAGALGVNLYNGCMVFGAGVISAASPMVARALGKRAHEVRDVRRSVRQAMWAAVLLVIPIWLLLWRTAAILVALGQNPILAMEAASLVRPMMFGMLPLFGYQILKAFITALDRPGWSFGVGAAAVCSNAVVNYGLIFGHFGLPRLGLAGAGLGSTISNSLMGLGLFIVVIRHRKFRRYRLFGNFWRADWARFLGVWRLGLPIGATLAMETTCFNAAVVLMGWIGEAQLAAHAIAIQVTSLTFQVPSALGQAATVRVGKAYGARDTLKTGRAGWSAFALTMAFMVLTAAMMLSMPRFLVSLFTGPGRSHGEVADFAVSFLGIAALFQIADGAQAIGAGMLRGLHDTTVPMSIAGLSYWLIGFGSAFLFAFTLGLGGIGVWIGLAAGLSAAGLLLMLRWARRERLCLV
jgi:MATE family multidrug resistance protein